MSVRVRFAPSPTGPLHIGGVRTALYNYLFARQHNGIFILRIEDTDQGRYVEGAEAYIQDALQWLGLTPDESPTNPGDFGPYRQSERRDLYDKYVMKLIASGKAYYAFDSAEELDEMRLRLEAEGDHAPKYDHKVRMSMKNSLTLSADEVQDKLDKNDPYTIRLKIDPGENITFQDIVRGEVTFRSDELDDKILMKSDGWPTYHLANIIDDHLMQITHVIRGEEWLSSTPHHVYLYRAFGWQENMPQFVHLPLILKPSGKGKLSKRDGAKFGFPVFPLDWNGDEFYDGFREKGFLPGAVINFLSLLGWHPEDDQEIFDIAGLVKTFELDRISKSGARFDYDKARWFNQQYIIQSSPDDLVKMLSHEAKERFGPETESKLSSVVELMAPRVEFVQQILEDGIYFFQEPSEIDEKPIRKKWKEESATHLLSIDQKLQLLEDFSRANIEQTIKGYIQDNELSFGAILPLLRIAISGTLKGPDLFAIFEVVGRVDSCARLTKSISRFKNIANG